MSVVLTGLICLVLWPWPHNFCSFMPVHFDPPFHAWKLQVIADKILHHFQLVPEPNTNIFYPNANEFYFDALLWPQGAFAALLTVFGSSPILTYNLTLLFFWVLSGCAFYLLLRELAFDPIVSLFGAAIFCLLPYRVSYFVEFNMEMAFGLPLFLYCWLRFFKHPTVLAGISLGVAFWLQAISELYQAVSLALAFPLLVMPFLPQLVRRHGRSARFYLASVAGLATSVVLCLVYLAPYYSLFSHGYTRNLGEMSKYSLEPLSYLGRTLAGLITYPHNRVKMAEMIVFPSFTILLLWAGYVWHGRTVARSRAGQASATPVLVLHWTRCAAWVVFAGLLILLARMRASALTNHLLFTVGNGCLLLAMGITVSIGILHRDCADRTRLLLHGLSAAALLGFILSLGPHLSVMTSHATANNLLFAAIRKVFPLDGLRVVSRFSVLVMVYVSVTAAVAMHQLRKRMQRITWAPLLALPLLVVEVHAIPHKYEKMHLPISPLLSSVIEQHPNNSVLVVPMGDRYEDARFMLGLAGTDTLLINGWGGFLPQFQEAVNRDLHTDLEHFYQTARAIWPEPLIVIDRPALNSHIMNTKTGSIPFAFRERFLARESKLLAAETNYSVYQLNSEPRIVVQANRYIRADLLRRNRQYTFQAKTAADGPASLELVVSLNNREVERVRVDRQWREYRVQVPLAPISGKEYESLTIRAENEALWMLWNNEFAPPS